MFLICVRQTNAGVLTWVNAAAVQLL